MPRVVKPEPESDVVTFDLDDLVQEDVIHITDLPTPDIVSYKTYDDPLPYGSWCSDNTTTCTWAECCD